jgi:uncharacterized protein YjbJ (UPF0337 family)
MQAQPQAETETSMSEDRYELEPEVLSYSAFHNRQVLRAWQERRRVYQWREYLGRSAAAVVADSGGARAVRTLYNTQERSMDKDQVSGGWHQLKGKVKEQWGKLTDDDLTQLEGHAEQLAGKIQQRYGVEKAEAERQVKEFRARNKWN